ncbi:MAG TPA: septum formation initiator family protein [Chitinivibrionales bacterium]|nr:septum formation initiator family protein [Chitinivibrionales bacterium]
MLKKKIKIKKVGRWIVLAAAALAAYSLFFGRASLVKIYHSFLDVKKKERALVQEHRDIDTLKVQNKKLEKDTAYMEKIAREKLGMARKDEKVYKFIQEPK